MTDILDSYFAAWNAPDEEERRRRLEESITADVELLDPAGRFHGLDELGDRIGRYRSGMPGTRVVLASDIDVIDNIARYAWTIIGPDGHEVMQGLDVIEQAEDGRLRRILMCHGPLPQADQFRSPASSRKCAGRRGTSS